MRPDTLVAYTLEAGASVIRNDLCMKLKASWTSSLRPHTLVALRPHTLVALRPHH